MKWAYLKAGEHITYITAQFVLMGFRERVANAIHGVPRNVFRCYKTRSEAQAAFNLALAEGRVSVVPL